MEAVLVENLSYQYRSGGPQVLKNISFQAARGEILAIAGLSGCGKSTLCSCISGIIPHCWDGVMTGKVTVNGKDSRQFKPAELALEAGMIFQNPDTQLFSPTVEDEIAFAPENLCLAPALIRERVDWVIELLEIEELREANPNRLSGGQKHLVALASVLALDPPILIFDEVMSQLDSEGKKMVAAAMENLRIREKTIILVEHDLEIIGFTDRLMVMESGEVIRLGNTGDVLRDTDFLIAKKLVY